MKPIRALSSYLALVLLGGAALAPWVYRAAQFAATKSSWFEGIASQPFHRYVNRCLYAAALAGLWWLLGALRLRSTRELGLAPARRALPAAGVGFATGFATLALVAALALGAGARLPNTELTFATLARHLANATASGLVVALLEETLFRGVVFGGLRKAVVPSVALVLSSALYSAVHFYERPPAPNSLAWTTGFETLARMFHGLAEWQRLVPGFFTLLVAGGILAWAYHATGTLWFSFGLHAGWVFWLKSYAFLTREVPGTHESLWGTGRLYDGWVALFVLLATAAALRWRFPPPRGVIQWR